MQRCTIQVCGFSPEMCPEIWIQHSKSHRQPSRVSHVGQTYREGDCITTRHAHLFKDFGEKIHSFGHCNLAMMELYMARGMDIQFYKRASIRCVFF